MKTITVGWRCADRLVLNFSFVQCASQPTYRAILKLNKEDKFTRTLWHPHVKEQPFTRSQHGLIIPDDIKEVVVKAHTTVDGWGGKELNVLLKDSKP